MNTETAFNILGYPGRMISGSKSGYMTSHPNNQVVFNANVCTDAGKIWFGDLDVTLDGEKLQQLANELHCKIYVLREHDGRFDNEDRPRLDKAAATFMPL